MHNESAQQSGVPHIDTLLHLPGQRLLKESLSIVKESLSIVKESLSIVKESFYGKRELHLERDGGVDGRVTLCPVLLHLVEGSGFMVECLWFMVQGLWFRV